MIGRCIVEGPAGAEARARTEKGRQEGEEGSVRSPSSFSSLPASAPRRSSGLRPQAAETSARASADFPASTPVAVVAPRSPLVVVRLSSSCASLLEISLVGSHLGTSDSPRTLSLRLCSPDLARPRARSVLFFARRRSSLLLLWSRLLFSSSRYVLLSCTRSAGRRADPAPPRSVLLIMSARLIDDVLVMILDELALPAHTPDKYRTRQETLRSVCLASRRLYRLAQPLLWRQVTVRTRRQLDCLVAVVSGGPGRHTKILTVAASSSLELHVAVAQARILPNVVEIRVTYSAPFETFDLRSVERYKGASNLSITALCSGQLTIQTSCRPAPAPRRERSAARRSRRFLASPRGALPTSSPRVADMDPAASTSRTVSSPARALRRRIVGPASLGAAEARRGRLPRLPRPARRPPGRLQLRSCRQ